MGKPGECEMARQLGWLVVALLATHALCAEVGNLDDISGCAEPDSKDRSGCGGEVSEHGAALHQYERALDSSIKGAGFEAEGMIRQSIGSLQEELDHSEAQSNDLIS